MMSGSASRMRRSQSALNYLPRVSAEVREDQALAQEWGCKESTAHQRKLDAMRDAVTVILVKRRLGLTDSLSRYTTRLDDATAADPQPEAEYREKCSDAEEDRLQAEYERHRCPETARPLLRKRATMRQSSLDHDREIAMEWGITL